MAETDAAPAEVAIIGINLEMHEFVKPKKEISLPEDIAKWEASEAYRDLLGFIGAMSDAVKNTKLTDPCYESPLVKNLIALIDTLATWIEEFPPLEQPQRFGNKAYRDWFKKLEDNAESLIKEALDEKFHRAVPEIREYLVEGVGNLTRIDYGTGHEMSFVTFLCCLYKIGALEEQDAIAVVNRVFHRYLVVMRKLQITYRMEPAGSQGVWALDDFQFIPFIWGSSQLLDHKRLKPKSFPDQDMCDAYAKDYMFFGCTQFIHQHKSGPFAEHSNQLWNISAVEKWSKVNSGLIKMYKAEVLNKFPVIQHYLFGSLMSITTAT